MRSDGLGHGSFAGRIEQASASESDSGCADRLVSMEELVDRAGHSPQPRLRQAYTREWMVRAVTEMVVAETGER